MINKKYFVLSLVILFLINVSLVHAEVLVSDANVSYESEIIEEFNNQSGDTFVWIVVYLKDPFTEEFTSIFSESEIKDILHRPISPNKFSAKVTKGGFDKLILDERVDRVFYNGKLYFVENDGNNTLPGNRSLSIVGVAILTILIVLIILIYYLIKRGKKSNN